YAGASSVGWPARPNGVDFPNSGRAPLGWPSETCRGVQIGPGATALTRIPRGASCWASPLVKLLMADLVGAWWTRVGEGSYAWIELEVTIVAPAGRCARAALEIR